MKRLKLDPSGAMFSDCRSYRWTLWRYWGSDRRCREPMCAFVGLNPSTADETRDDPTVRRCIRYAQAWGFAGMYMLNIFGYRATDPAVMRSHLDPVGVDNDYWIAAVARRADQVVLCWGNHGLHLERSQQVRRILKPRSRTKAPIFSFGLTGQGEPKHPLYLARTTPLTPFAFD